MKRYNLIFILTVLLASCVIWVSNSFAVLGPPAMINVEGLSLDEAQEKYGIASGNNHPVIFEVNAQSGLQRCELIGPDGSKACPIAKIFYQSPHVIPNNDGTRSVKVDIYYDVNEVTTERGEVAQG
ncbi:MAG: hypothetical protein WGN25_00750 [Candidatus Electrothrix sp. GW3-4]|uniref:hypothetical protein n=1 Tax=Candidatus Electrothrix sp. GW3-4 TaxID=3126740 RepID=UPI0030D4CC62